MESKIRTEIKKDLQNRKIVICREFDAPTEMVWAAWTESALLDQWWAPRPWFAKTKSLQFKEGGNWLYAMEGPESEVHWVMVEFTSIQKNKSFEASSVFTDEKGIRNPALPKMHWKNVFLPTSYGTRVEVEISFDKEADLNQIIAMGFEAGFTAALGNLDELLVKHEI